jgi:hypothetical protein
MAAVAMSAGVAFSQGMSLGKSEFAGKLVKQSAATIAPAKFQNAAVSVRAAGYDEELVKTAVRVLFCLCFFGVCLSLGVVFVSFDAPLCGFLGAERMACSSSC